MKKKFQFICWYHNTFENLQLYRRYWINNKPIRVITYRSIPDIIRIEICPEIDQPKSKSSAVKCTGYSIMKQNSVQSLNYVYKNNHISTKYNCVYKNNHISTKYNWFSCHPFENWNNFLVSGISNLRYFFFCCFKHTFVQSIAFLLNREANSKMSETWQTPHNKRNPMQ